ncbi:MAG: class I SAM-dependent methyltransferase [Elusimicrobiota bacterium]
MKNRVYRSKEISDYYSRNRNSFNNFYPSEKRVFMRVYEENGSFGDILDVGCACGGLASALKDKFGFDSYTGIDINAPAIQTAKRNFRRGAPLRFVAGDILKQNNIAGKYDTVFSLSCADWNLQTKKIISSCWKALKPGGHFIISLRLARGKSVNDIKKSYQYINFSGKDKKPEIANYVVFSLNDALKLFEKQKPAPESISAYGYWGKPSKTARTLYKKLVFGVFYVKKPTTIMHSGTIMKLKLPEDIL